MASFENALPVEQWLQVLEMVPLKDLCNVMLTSEHMNSMASSQDLWVKTKVNKEKAMRNGLTPLFIIDRFKKIKEIDFSSMGDWITSQMLENLLNDIQESSLEKVDFHVTDLSRAPAEPLAKAVSHLKAVDLAGTLLTSLQSTKVMETSLSSDSLEELDLTFVDLSGVPANLLASAVCRLKIVSLAFTRLTAQQSATFGEACTASPTLVDVDLTGLNLSGVPADPLARAVCRLKSVNLEDTRLTTLQSATIVEACIASTTLVDVTLTVVNLSGVPAELLGRLVGRLQSVHLCDTEMTRDQGIAIGQAVLASTSLRLAYLRDNQLHQKLPAQLFNSLSRMVNVII